MRTATTQTNHNSLHAARRTVDVDENTSADSIINNNMAKGRRGFWLEGWKFGMYLMVPICASFYFDNPDNQRKAQDYWKFVQYPANPNTGMKESIEQAAKLQKQREVYREQLQLLQEANAPKAIEDDSAKKSGKGWLRWVGLGRRKAGDEGNDASANKE